MAKRATEIILRNEYKPTKKLHVNRPFKLSNAVSSKRDKQDSASCVSEMTTLMACWAQNEYQDSKCGPEMEVFNKCTKATEANRKAMQKAAKASVAPAGRTMTTKQVNHLLKRYPQET